jgi:hypothetical protein
MHGSNTASVALGSLAAARRNYLSVRSVPVAAAHRQLARVRFRDFLPSPGTSSSRTARSLSQGP